MTIVKRSNFSLLSSFIAAGASLLCCGSRIGAIDYVDSQQSTSSLNSIVLSDASVADRGLRSLAEERIPLSLDELRRLTSKAPRITYAVLEYIETMRDTAYLPAVEALALGPDTAMATKAKRVLEGLEP